MAITQSVSCVFAQVDKVEGMVVWAQLIRDKVALQRRLSLAESIRPNVLGQMDATK